MVREKSCAVAMRRATVRVQAVPKERRLREASGNAMSIKKTAMARSRAGSGARGRAEEVEALPERHTAADEPAGTKEGNEEVAGKGKAACSSRTSRIQSRWRQLLPRSAASW